MAEAGPPDVDRYLELVRSSRRPPFERLSVAAARALYRAGRDTIGLPPVALHAVTDDRLAGTSRPIAIRRYVPLEPDAPGPAILFFHGGGWVIGDLDTHDGICRHLAAVSGCQVIAVDYRLAPEHRFPAAFDDAVDAFESATAAAGALMIDPTRLAVAGDSAGGGLALATALHGRARGNPAPCAQLLFYPVADLRGATPSYREVADVPITAATMAWFQSHYLDEANVADWRASPLLAPDFHGLAPTFLTVAGRDPLRDEGLALARRLADARVQLELRYLPRHPHGYLTAGRVIAEAGRSLDGAARFLTDLTDCVPAR